MNSSLRKFFLSLVFTSAFINPAQAQGIPTIDIANLIQGIQQLLAWYQQYEQMYVQIQQQYQQIVNAEKQLENMSGQRMLGMIRNELRASAVDPNFSAQLSAATSDEQARLLVQEQLRRVGQATGIRYNQIQSLMAEINNTTDPKSIAELNGRIQAEQAMIALDAKDVAMLQAQYETRRQEQEKNRADQMRQALLNGN